MLKKYGNLLSLKLLVPVYLIRWLCHLASSTDCILDLELSFNIRFPFLKLYPLKVLVVFLFFLFFFASLFLSLVSTYLIYQQSHYSKSFIHVYSSAFLLSQKGFCSYNVYPTEYMHSVYYFGRGKSHILPLNRVVSITLSLRPSQTEVCSTWW